MNGRSLKHLIPVSILAILLAVCLTFETPDLLSLLALPFTLVGDSLRVLSLSGSVCNLFAVILYVLIALLPLTLLLRKNRGKEDILLPLCSALMFYVLYYMVNPTLRPLLLQSAVGDSILSGTVYSVLGCWAVIKLVRYCGNLTASGSFRILRSFLYVCAALFLVAIAVKFTACRMDITAFSAENTLPGLSPTATVIFSLLAFAVSALEYGLMIVILLYAANLLSALELDPYSADCTAAAAQVSLWSHRSLLLVVIANTVLHVAQLLFASRIQHLNVVFHIPVVGLAISFTALALSHLLVQGNRLKEDNDLFI